MKIRNGFVSNSSSSSFCIIGVMNCRNAYSTEGIWLPEYNSDKFEEIEKQYEKDHWGGYSNLDDNLVAIGDYDDIDYVGIDCSKLIEEGKSFNEIKKMFLNKMKEIYNMDLPEESVHLYYGESSSE